MYLCFNCNSELIWQSDFMQSELWGGCEEEDDDRIVNVLQCPNCHADVYCVHPSPNMEREYEEEENNNNLEEQQ